MDLEELLAIRLERYFQLIERGYEIKERVGMLGGNIDFQIYTKDHNPPHFHVRKLDNSINAKFKLEDGEYISGMVSSKNQRLIKGFFEENKETFKQVWNKRN